MFFVKDVFGADRKLGLLGRRARIKKKRAKRGRKKKGPPKKKKKEGAFTNKNRVREEGDGVNLSKNQTQFSLVQKYPLKWSSKNKKSEKNKKCPPNGGKKRGRKVRSEKKCPPNGEKKRGR